MSYRHFSTGAKLSWVGSVCTPRALLLKGGSGSEPHIVFEQIMFWSSHSCTSTHLQLHVLHVVAILAPLFNKAFIRQCSTFCSLLHITEWHETLAGVTHQEVDPQQSSPDENAFRQMLIKS